MPSTLTVKNLSYVAKEKQLLTDISFSIDENEKLILLGHNGSGKSLLIDCILGNLTFDGSVKNKFNNKNELGVLYDQFASFPLLKVREILSLLESIYKVPRDNELLKKLGLKTLIDKYFKVLSKGEIKKVGLYAALFFRPKFLILDEPTDGLDPEFRDFFWDFLKNTQVTLLLTTHLWEEVKKIADKIIFIEQGRILNTPKPYAELLSNINPQGKIVIEDNKSMALPGDFTTVRMEEKLLIYFENQQRKDDLIEYIEREVRTGYSIVPVDIKDAYYLLKNERK